MEDHDPDYGNDEWPNANPWTKVPDTPVVPSLFKGRKYSYKGNVYTFFDFTKIKFGGQWLAGVIYTDKDGYPYTREQLDFLTKFKPVD